ncbi:hypothetical protein D5S17_07815 [Pseudonocardiaceae bacterium YIM PH 21723]|nr:hypothetical protein D5S17_07815 [Pseudonocardiaceae bacterium YIM PH 21723]
MCADTFIGDLCVGGVVKFRILGPVEIIRDGTPLPIGGPRNRAVLAALATDVGRAVNTEKLAGAVWGEQPPATVRAQIQICISALRRLELPITSSYSGYTLDVDPFSVDATQFHALIAQARALSKADGYRQEAADLLRSAVDLWRGPALDGVPGLAAEAARLDEARIAATGDLMDMELQFGRHSHLISELTTLAREYPLQERFQAQLMLALYRSSRQAEALRVYRDLREMMHRDLGLEPGLELQSLERRMLMRDPALAYSETVQEQPLIIEQANAPRREQIVRLPPETGVFTGRSREIERITEQLLGTGSPVVLTGPVGIGKSALAVQTAYGLSGHFPDGVLYLDLRAADPQEAVSQLLGQLGEDPAGDRDRYAERVATGRMLLVFDGVTDEEQIRGLLPRTMSAAVLITSRSRLTALEGSWLLEVDPLDEDAGMDLLGNIIGHHRLAAEPEAARAVVGQCERLPFAIRIAGARLLAKPHWSLTRFAGRLEPEATRLDELAHADLRMRSVLDLEYTALDPILRWALRRLSLPRVPYLPSWLAAALLDLSLPQTENVLESLLDARLLTAVPAPLGDDIRYRLPSLVWLFARERARIEDSPMDTDAAQDRARLAGLRLMDELGSESPSLDQLDPAQRAAALADPAGWLTAHQDILGSLTC